MFAPISYAGPQPFNDWFLPDTVQRVQLGLQLEAVDPYWGWGVFQYVKSNDAILKGSAVIVGTMPTFLGTLYPNTANLASPVGFAMAPMAAGTFGWLQVAGAAVYKTNATVAADVPIGIAAAGIVGTFVTGKGFLGVHNVKSATATTALTNVQTTQNSNILFCPGGFDGWFLGMALSGANIPASTVVASLNADGRTVVMGSAIGTPDKLATATGSITVTGTYTGFGAGLLTYPTGTNITV